GRRRKRWRVEVRERGGGGGGGVGGINPKSEARNPKQIRMTKGERSKRRRLVSIIASLNIGICFGFRISDFVLLLVVSRTPGSAPARPAGRSRTLRTGRDEGGD